MKKIFEVAYSEITKNIIFYSLLVAYAISCNKSLPINEDISLFYEIEYSLEGKILLFYCSFVCSMMAFAFFKKYWSGFQIEFGIVSCILSIFNVISFSYMENNTLDLLYASCFQIVKMAIVFVGVFLVYYLIISYIYIYIHNLSNNNDYESISLKKGIIILIFVFLCNTVVAYPVAFTPDSVWQFLQGMGETQVSKHNPLLLTWLISNLTKAGKIFFDSYNIGAFFYNLFQFVFFSYVFSYSLVILYRLKIRKLYINCVLAVYCLCPLIIGYIGVCIKDTIYSVAFLLFIISLYEMRLSEREFKRFNCVFYKINFAISGFYIITLRKEGKYVFLFMALIALVLSQKSNFKKILILFLIIFLSSEMVDMVIYKSYNEVATVAEASPREALSIPLQQVARLVSQHGDDISNPDKEIIDKVLVYDTLKERYNPMLSDPVKNYYCWNSDVTEDDVILFFKIWFKYGLKYPFTYLSATLNQNYPLFSLDYNDAIYYNSCELNFWDIDQLFIKDVDSIEKIDSVFINYYKLEHHLPFLELIANRSFWCIALVIFSTIGIKRRDKWHLIIMLPLWATLIICILGPAVNGHPRYVFPIVYSMPFIIASFLCKNPILDCIDINWPNIIKKQCLSK